jgi:hypothetical protein
MATTPNTVANAETIVTETESFFNSPVFHNHIRTWMFVILAFFIMGFLYVHESNANAAKNALAAQIEKQGAAEQAHIDAQIAAVHNDTATQVKQIQAQIDQTQTVAQAIAAIRTNVPPVTITPIITQPATSSAPAVTTADTKATGDLPVATISGDGLKTLADNTYACKQQAVEFDGCKQTLTLEQSKTASLTQENEALKKIKVVPAWKKTVTTIGHIALGILIGKAIP